TFSNLISYYKLRYTVSSETTFVYVCVEISRPKSNLQPRLRPSPTKGSPVGIRSISRSQTDRTGRLYYCRGKLTVKTINRSKQVSHPYVLLTEIPSSKSAIHHTVPQLNDNLPRRRTGVEQEIQKFSKDEIIL